MNLHCSTFISGFLGVVLHLHPQSVTLPSFQNLSSLLQEPPTQASLLSGRGLSPWTSSSVPPGDRRTLLIVQREKTKQPQIRLLIVGTAPHLARCQRSYLLVAFILGISCVGKLLLILLRLHCPPS